MTEGSLGAPIRHPIDWHSDEFYDEALLDKELRRVFDICHGCRRCFNLCSSFPTLFDLIDDAEEEELDGVDSADFKKVADDCTLCDMCFLTKCPYVPPHEFNLDFPHLILRYRAVEHKKGMVKFNHKQLTRTDRNGRLGVMFAGLMNVLTARKNRLVRLILRTIAGISDKVELPTYAKKSLVKIFGNHSTPVKAEEKKVALFVGCHCNYSDTEIGKAAFYLFDKFGVKAEIVYPECCGMPQMETGNLPEAAAKAERISAVLAEYVDKGYDVVGLTPSCTLLMKFEWVLLLPDNDNCKKLSASAYDISEYIVNLAKSADNLPPVVTPIEGGVSFHVACHARAQNMGQKGAELLRLLPDVNLNVVERCSGHGGAWGVMADNFDTAVKVGRPAARAMNKGDDVAYITSECPLATLHLGQIIGDSADVNKDGNKGLGRVPQTVAHPLILLAHAYGMDTTATAN